MVSSTPSVAFRLALTHEVRQVTSFSDLLALAGTRAAVGTAWGVALRTYDRRKQDPGSITVLEIQKLAIVLAVNEQDLFAVVSASARRLAVERRQSGSSQPSPAGS